VSSITVALQSLRDERLTLDARGSTEAEVAALESQLRSRLPAPYRAFLLALGADPGHFMPGSDLALKDLTRINEEARRIVAAAGQTLPAAAFAFLMHQGYQFLCFNLGEGDDPPVHHFIEQVTLKPLGKSFSEWFRLAADDAVRDHKELDLAGRLALVRAAASGTLIHLPCPSCVRSTVSVRFTHPAPTEWRTWFICSSCKFEMRTQDSGRPQHFKEDLVDRDLQERDRR
jgi:hypothetical protein